MTLDTKNDSLDLDIKATADALRDQAEANWEALSKAYWKAHRDVAETSFTSRWDQMRAIRKLSQLGLALHAAGEALSALSLTRSN
jgi:hypothetical protein